MVDFLRSEEAMNVFSNSHELLAMANMYNITINVFTFGGSADGWTEIPPDPVMVTLLGSSIAKGLPDVALYHSYDNHYDLLVKRESRIALLGLLAGSASTGDDVQMSKSKLKDIDEERLLEENEILGESIKDIDEETTLANAKKKGFRRTGPQEGPELSSSEPTTHKCMECKFEFESDGILKAHMETHRKSIPVSCTVCSESFVTEECLKVHMLSKHNSKENLNEWNCNDCAFEANCASELMKHLKITSHQPSKNVKDKRTVFEDYKQCYTCKMDFDGFYNLKNHRKSVHPSNKKCRNFLSGKCTFADECWYVHEETLNAEDSLDNFKCDLCAKEYKGRANFMRHKKLLHLQFVPQCEQFSAGKCSRGEKECWFVHKESRKNPVDNNPWPKLPVKTNDSVFHKANPHAVPPGEDQLNMMMKMIGNLCSKIQKMEDKFEDLMS